MRVLFAAPENAWGGFLHAVRRELPEHDFQCTGCFCIETLSGFDVLIPTMSPVTRELLEQCDCLRLIQQCGVGLEGVDLQAACEKDIWVANVPSDISGNADSVAELGIYLMIGLSRNLSGMQRSLAAGKMGEPMGRALKGKTVGIVGLGGIGQALAQRLRSFGVRLAGIRRHDLQATREALGLEWIGGPDNLDELLSRSDFVVLSLPLTAGNKHLIDRRAFSMMKKDAFLINLSRGGLVERDALHEALQTGRIAGAGLDVFWEEPPDPEDPIFACNVLATPHIAGSTDISMQGIVQAAADNIRRVAQSRKPLHCVN